MFLNKTNLYKSLLVLSALLIFTGCAKNEAYLMNIEKFKSEPKIVLQNEKLAKWLFLEELTYDKRADDLLEVEARFQNKSDFNEKVAYKIDWKDKKGFTYKSILSKWVVVEIEERRELIIKGISPSTKVEGFRIRIQQPTSDDKYRQNQNNKQYQGY